MAIMNPNVMRIDPMNIVTVNGVANDAYMVDFKMKNTVTNIKPKIYNGLSVINKLLLMIPIISVNLEFLLIGKKKLRNKYTAKII